MKFPRLLPLVALTPLALAAAWVAEKPSYQPKAGTVLSKHVALQGDLQLEEMSMEMNGQDMSAMVGQVEMAMKTSMKLSVTDHYEAVEGGRPTKLKRSFDEISSSSHISQSNPQMGETENDIPLASELQGSTVLFTWDPEESAYDVTFAGDQKGDEELLVDLEEDLDLRGFLPTSEVAEGASWKVPTEAVKAAVAPGGNVKLHPEGTSEMMGGMDQFSQNDLIGELEGEFLATFAGTRKEDGVSVAVIQLKIDAQSAQDMTERSQEMQEQMKGNLPDGMDVAISAFDVEWEYKAEGELLWNLETGLVHALNLSGEVRLIIDLSMAMSMGGQGSQAMDLSQTLTGNQTLTLTTGD